MNSTKKRSDNWTAEDKILLKELVKERVSVLENKNTDTNANNQKVASWADLHQSFNSMRNGAARTVAQLKNQWSTLKSTEKRAISAEKKARFAAGGGPPPPEDSTGGIGSDSIRSWLPLEFETDSNEFDSDAINQVLGAKTGTCEPDLAPLVLEVAAPAPTTPAAQAAPAPVSPPAQEASEHASEQAPATGSRQRANKRKFRRSVKDVTKPEHDDHFLLRWLRARQWDADAAEKMLRDSLAWREKWGIDTSLSEWKAPEVLEKHFPSGSTGFDKEGSPVIIIPFMGLDAWGMLHSVTKSDVIRMILRHLENYLVIARKQAETHGPQALKVTVLFDLEGFNIRQYAWKPAAEMVFTLLQLYEANYPEILKSCFIVNAPKVFSLAFSVIKKFIHEYTISKIKIYGSDAKKWQAAVLALVDRDQLPVHYGGTIVDDNGDPRCSLIVKPGGKVPKSYYSRNSTGDGEKEYKRASIKTGDKHVIDMLCGDGESVLKWEAGVDHHEIKFVIKRRDEEGAETVVYGPKKISEGPMEVGIMPITGPATYSVIFDNKSAFLRSKKVFYHVIVAVPERDLNMNIEPDEDK